MSDETQIEMIIQGLAEKFSMDFGVMKKAFTPMLQTLQDAGRLDPATVDIKESCILQKFDHAQSEKPQLVETITVDEHGRKVVQI